MSITVSANQGNDDPPVSLYPVPCNINTLKIKLLPSVLEKAKTIELRNFIGRKLQTQAAKSGVMEFTEMSQYSEGVYVIIIKDGSGKIIESSKFMITK